MAIQTYVSAVTVDALTGQPLVVLQGVDDKRLIPIRVGAVEARAIDRAYRRSRFATTDAHDVLLKFIEEVHGDVTAVALEEMEAGRMIAYFRVQTNGKAIVIDCRPSDAISIAVKTGNPIWLSATTLGLEGKLDEGKKADESERDAFRNFVSDLKPSDFKLDR
jgi:hypothetical protein